MFCLFDVDRFKHINDTLGHAIGDEVLKAIAEAMRNTFRTEDIAMRLGGDEFAVFIKGVNDRIEGAVILERLVKKIGEINQQIPGLEENIRVSMGVVFAKNDKEETFDSIYRRVDEVMYICKKQKTCDYLFA